MADGNAAVPGGLDKIKLTSAVYALDPIVALLALAHLTGDRLLLSTLGKAFDGVPRANQNSFRPTAQEGGPQVDPAIVEDIRQRLIAAMLVSQTPLLTYPDRALFAQMAELCLGRAIQPANLAMGREQAGFSKDEGAAEALKTPSPDFKVLVLGAGMMGLVAAVKLKAAGFDFHLVERNDRVGGTWVTNRYPNVAVDTPSVQYSLSFEQNSSWTKYYPRGPEYQSYLDQVCDKYGIRDHIDFNTSLKSSVWDDDRKIWTVTCVRNGREVVYEANVVIVAFGFLTRPLLPEVDGLDRFKGPVVHSGEWDDSIELDGKKVVLVGTGATAAQIATNVGARAKHLTVIQRQSNYMMPDPRVMKEVDPDERWALENIPFVTQWQRFQSLGSLMTITMSPCQIDPEYRARTGGVSAMNEAARQASVNYVRHKFADRPDLAEKLTPDFPFFAKRPILDCGYYDTLLKDNVELVSGAVASVEEHGVVLADGRHIECDVLLLATGWTLDYLSAFDIRGRGGLDLQDLWSPVPFAYKGLEMPGFPNFFVTSGPNSALTSSHTTLSEQQVHYIVETLKLMVDEDLAAIEVTEKASADYNQTLDKRLANTIWIQSGTAHGYYRHATGKIVLGFPGPNVELWSLYRRPDPADHILTLRAQKGAALESVKVFLT
jgi:cation diffusion facilitator CzcD-associated flavoprotein CzcO